MFQETQSARRREDFLLEEKAQGRGLEAVPWALASGTARGRDETQRGSEWTCDETFLCAGVAIVRRVVTAESAGRGSWTPEEMVA